MEPPEAAALDGGAGQGPVADEVADVAIGDGQGVGGLGNREPLAQVGVERLPWPVLRDRVEHVSPPVHGLRQVRGCGREHCEPFAQGLGGPWQRVDELGDGEQRVGVHLPAQHQQPEAHVALQAVARPSPVRTMRPACSRESSIRFSELRAMPVSRRRSPEDFGRWSKRTT